MGLHTNYKKPKVLLLWSNLYLSVLDDFCRLKRLTSGSNLELKQMSSHRRT